jgi:AcrR family transcriptional regulator
MRASVDLVESGFNSLPFAAMAARLTCDERREHLLQVGMELLGHRGTADVSIEEIARAAGVSNGLLYHYFPTKSDFLLAVLKRSQQELDTRLARDPELSALDQFDRNLDGLLRFVDEHAAGYLAAVEARGVEPRVQALVEERRRRRLDELVALAAALHGRPRDEIRTPMLTTAIEGWLAMSQAVIVRWLRDRALERDAVHALLRRGLLDTFAAVLASEAAEAAEVA